MSETQRTGWLGDEDALEEYFYGPICEGCGLRGEDCTCDAQEEERDPLTGAQLRDIYPEGDEIE